MLTHGIRVQIFNMARRKPLWNHSELEKHGIKIVQVVDTVFDTVFSLWMSTVLFGLRWTLKIEKPRFHGV
jgi:hypothetical protein